MTHDKFTGHDRPGMFGNGSASQKLDYTLMSPQVANKVNKGGVERHGVSGGEHGSLFAHFPEIKAAKDVASDRLRNYSAKSYLSSSDILNILSAE